MKQKAYVTGADRGLGLGLVNILLGKKYKVFAGSYMPEWHELQTLKAEYPEDLTILPLDVNSAGNAQDRSGTILDPQYYDDVRALYETNAIGPLRVTHSVIELLLKADVKTLVNISSVAGSVSTITRNYQYGYTMSKAAVNMQSKLIHNHLHDQGLKVLAIHPGWMRSHIFGNIERMKDAPLEPIESAHSIIHLVETKSVTGGDIYMDYAGNHLTW
jgi:NAD(P)-dependent dehydrogenase (short-subunit alcohol dehydrogenase family)